MPDLSFLFTLPPWVWLIALVVILALTFFLAKYFRVSKLKVNTGLVEIEAERKEEKPATGQTQTAQSKHYDVNIQGNIWIGAGFLRIVKNSAQFARNLIVGKPKIEVKPEPKKKRK